MSEQRIFETRWLGSARRRWSALLTGAVVIAGAASGVAAAIALGRLELTPSIARVMEVSSDDRTGFGRLAPNPRALQGVAASLTMPASPRALPPAPRPRLHARPITDAERNHGFGECFAPDPLGLGPYAPYRKVAGARVAVPQRGGHTEELGYDVVVHFHGGDPARKTFVQVVSGTVLVAVDKGVGSGPYQEAFVRKEAWTHLRAGVESALRAHAGDERAHIRHLALSGWSAGYGAVNQILATNGPAGIDAVVLLDGLHAGKNPRWPGPDDGSLAALSAGTVRAAFDYAAGAARGERIFVLTHANVVPTGYASVRRTADLLLAEVGLERAPHERGLGLAQQLTAADRAGLHVWGFDGRYEEAHCAQVSLLGEIVRDVLEPVWGTPEMDRAVPATPAPALGGKPRPD